MTLIYPGSFDPVTLGHIDIALRSAKIASRLIVAVLVNPNKKPAFTIQERVGFLQHELGSISNVEIDSFSGLLAEYAKLKSATAIVRGLRNGADFENEANYAALNRLLSDGIETIYIQANSIYSFVSGSAVREIVSHIYSSNLSTTALGNLVTPTVQKALEQRFNASKNRTDSDRVI